MEIEIDRTLHENLIDTFGQRKTIVAATRLNDIMKMNSYVNPSHLINLPASRNK